MEEKKGMQTWMSFRLAHVGRDLQQKQERRDQAKKVFVWPDSRLNSIRVLFITVVRAASDLERENITI